MPLEIRMSKLGIKQGTKASAESSKVASQASTPPIPREKLQVPRPMSLDAFREPMYFAYLFDNFVWSSFANPWLQQSAEGKLGSLPYQACKALSQSTFGKYHSQPDIELEATVSYCKVVSRVRLGLSEPGNEAADLLLPMLILLMHANLTMSYTEGSNHIRGIIGLLQTCGPEPFQRSDLRPAFSSTRSTLITVSMLTRQRSFLEEERWRLAPWASDPGSKSDQDKLVDILAFLPGLLQELNPLLHAPIATVIETTHNFCLQVQHGLRALLTWRRAWDAKYPQVARMQPRTDTKRTSYPAGAESLLCYSTFTRAVEYSLYNAIFICLVNLLSLIETPENVSYYTQAAAYASHTMQHGTHHRTTSCLLAPAEQWDMEGAAKEIVRAFEFQLLNVARCRESALYWLFPLSLAYRVLEGETEWCEWIEELLNASQKSRGYGKGSVTVYFNFFPLSNRKNIEQGAGNGHDSGRSYEATMKWISHAAAARVSHESMTVERMVWE